ncbi:dihydrodipicolinate synthase family protein [Bacillus sp. JJ1566]|uniref:dihydrodipicolinate synthase family protein n=1 Tax=Bacillus sp. JJ1566 TaxID=3122961 RepID=UPI002FFDFC05
MSGISTNIINKMIVPALTFFNNDLSIDWTANQRYAERLAVYPIHGVIIFGSTGEGSSLSTAERIKLTEIYSQCLNKNQHLYVVLGYSNVLDEKSIITTSTDRVTGYLLLPKSENKRIDPYDKRRLKWLTHSIPSDKKIYLYSLKKTTGISFVDPSVVTELIQEGIPIDGLKISHEELDVIKDLITLRTWRNQPLDLLWGSDRHIEESLTYGTSFLVSSMLACYPNQQSFQNDALFLKELTDLRKSVGKGAAKLSIMKEQISSSVHGTTTVRPPYVN